ncbi:MAG TPA: O-antigen ligase family protein [Candidatus Elarobacter sp.]
MIAAYERPIAGERNAARAPSASLAARAFITTAFVLALVLARLVAPDSADTGSSAIAQLIWAVIYAGAVIGLIAEWARVRALIARSPLVLAVVVLAILSVMWSDDPYLTLRRSVGLVGTTAVAYYAVARLTLDEFIDVFAVVAGLVAVVSAFFIAFLPDAGVMQQEYAGAWRGVFEHKNSFGLFLSACIIVLVISAVRSRGTRRLIAWSVLAMCAVELLGSQSLTSALVAALNVVLLGALWYASKGRAQRRAVAFFAVLGAVAIGLAAWVVTDGFTGGTVLGRDTTLTGRTDIWPSVIDAIWTRPLFGFGYDVFWSDNGPYLHYLPAAVGWRPYHAHNGYLELALDVGAAGVAVAAAAILRGLVAAWRSIPAAFNAARAWPLLALVYFVLLNLTESYIAKYNNFDWIVFVAAFLYAMSAASGPAKVRR